MNVDYWIELLAGQKGKVDVVESLDPKLKWDIMKAREVLRNLLKKLEGHE